MKRFYNFLILMTLCLVVFGSCVYVTQEESHPKNKPMSNSSALFVGSDRHENGRGNNLAALLQAVSSNLNSTYPGLVFLGGDYVGYGPDLGPTGQPVFSVSEVRDEISRALGDGDYEALLTYGSHDKGCTDGYDAFFSGPHVCDGYYVYGISYAQMKYPTDSIVNRIDSTYTLKDTVFMIDSMQVPFDTIAIVKDSIVSDTTANAILSISYYQGLDLQDRFGISAESSSKSFTAWVNSLSDHAPIVVMSHIPMHANRNDNPGAIIWYQALRKAAKQHDIIVLFGHNHTPEEQGNPKDAYSYLLVPGDSIYIQGTDSVYGQILNFSYANAGYIKLGYASLITFYNTDDDEAYDEMMIRRYSLNGENNDYFGLTGKRNPYYLPLSKTR